MTDGEPQQLTLAHMPAQLFACTPSRLATFDCPRRYRFTYLDRPTPPRGAPWARNTVGAVAHVALQQWWSLPRGRRTPAEGAALVRRYWQDAGFRDADQSARARAETASWVEQYLTDHVDAGREPVGVERTVAARTERLAVSGRIDRLDDRDGELVVVDYKTGRHEPSPDDARTSQALALYVLGVRRTLHRSCHRVELHHLPTGTVAAAEHDEASLRNHVTRAEQTAQDVVAATVSLNSGTDPDVAFPVRTGPGCSWCDFRGQCPQGRAASREREPWAGLSDAVAGLADQAS